MFPTTRCFCRAQLIFGILLCVSSGCSKNWSEKPGAKTQPEGSVADSLGLLPNRDAVKPKLGNGPSKFDPVDVNGKIFENWPKPKLAIVISGQQNGYLEPCGCAGLANMKGGLMRRHTFLKQLRDPNGFGWPAVLAIDLGNLVRRYGWLATQKYEMSANSLKTMDYDAVAFGPDDLRLGVDPLLLAADDYKGRYVAANLILVSIEDTPTVRYRVIERGGYKIGVTAVLGKKYQLKVSDDLITIKDPAAALAEVLPKLEQANCDLLILLSHATIDESKAFAAKFKQFDVVVTAGGPDESPLEPEKLMDSDRWLIETGKKGMYLSVIGLFDDAQTPRRFQRVPVDSRFKDSPQIKKLTDDLQGKFKDHYLQLGWGGLGITALPHASGLEFVGSDHCGDCHTTAHEIWKDTPHSHAMETLAKLDPPRQFDPECVSCHVTGWAPQKHFPLESGYESLKKTPLLAGNGCENCHGPGSQHVAIEEGNQEADEALRLKTRRQMRLTLAKAKDQGCAICHDLDNSPDYVIKGFDAFWEKVKHKGKD